jgi:hypothetical protein
MMNMAVLALVPETSEIHILAFNQNESVLLKLKNKLPKPLKFWISL